MIPPTIVEILEYLLEMPVTFNVIIAIIKMAKSSIKKKSIYRRIYPKYATVDK